MLIERGRGGIRGHANMIDEYSNSTTFGLVKIKMSLGFSQLSTTLTMLRGADEGVQSGRFEKLI